MPYQSLWAARRGIHRTFARLTQIRFNLTENKYLPRVRLESDQVIKSNRQPGERMFIVRRQDRNHDAEHQLDRHVTAGRTDEIVVLRQQYAPSL